MTDPHISESAEMAVACTAVCVVAWASQDFIHARIGSTLGFAYVGAAALMFFWLAYPRSDRRALVWAFALLFGASLSRAVVFIHEFITEGQRLAGIGLNVLICLYCLRVVGLTRESERCLE